MLRLTVELVDEAHYVIVLVSDWLELDADDSEEDLWKRASEVLKAIIAGRGRERMRAQRSL